MQLRNVRDASAKDSSVRDRFTAAAQTYDEYAQVQARVIGRLLHWIDPSSAVDRLLEIGCGTGLLTVELRKRLPASSLTALDLSSGMLHQAESKLRHDARIQWIAQDVRDFHPEKPFPLIVSSSTLHWLESPGEAIRVVDRLTEPGGSVVISVMLRGTLGELHTSRAHVAPHKAAGRHLLPLTDWVAATESCGWNLRAAREELLPVKYGSAAAMLSSLNRQGVTGGPVSRSAALLTRRELAALKLDYQQRYGDSSGQVTATFRVGFIAASKGI